MVSGGAFSSGNINVLLGVKILDSGDWGDLQAQGAGGVQWDFKAPDWPLSVAIDFLGSYNEHKQQFIVPGTGVVGDEWQALTSELDLGVRKHWGQGASIRPFVGGGIAVIGAQLEAQTSQYHYLRDAGLGVGLWVNGGVLWTLSQHFNIGFDARISAAEVELFDQNMQAGGFYLGLLLGYRWDRGFP